MQTLTHWPDKPEERTALADFQPDASRATLMDRRMRERLRHSLEHIREQAGEALELDTVRFADLLDRISAGPVSPELFGIYYELVAALEDGALDEAQDLLEEMFARPDAANHLQIRPFGGPDANPRDNRYLRLMNIDPDSVFPARAPDARTFEAARDLLAEGLRRMDSHDPALAAEMRALVREIVIATGPSTPGEITFDGASSFMLWGLIFLNADGIQTPLDAIQLLVHEGSHNLLFGLTIDDDLVENPDEERFRSPLRADPRPMDGIFHATIITARMHRAVQGQIDSGHLNASEGAVAREAAAADARLFADGLATVEQHGRLTPMGRAALESAKAYMAG